MTKKKFIKILRSYRMSRNDIDKLVSYIIKSKGKVSYNESIEKIQMSILKRLIKYTCKEIPIDFTYAPVEYVDFKISELDMYITEYLLDIKPIAADKYIMMNVLN